MADPGAVCRSASSPMLGCLLQLGQDTFTQVLLPKLVQQGSAQAVALTCTHLRSLCHSSVQHLTLSAVLSAAPPSTAEDYTVGLAQHFPSCSSVQLSVKSAAHYQAAHYLLPSLARLANLSSLQLRVGGNKQALAIATLLLSVRTQLTNLCSLQVTADDSWTEAALAWLELGRFTRLEDLAVDLSLQAEGSTVCYQEDLLAISSLINLQTLELHVPPVQHFQEHPVTLQAVAGMHQLTCLEVSLSYREGLAALQACVNLRGLTVAWSSLPHRLKASDWKVVGQMTGLTKLALLSHLAPRQPEAVAACCSALVRLTGLQELSGDYWRPALLPALQQLSQLTHIRGGWLDDDSPHVKATVTLPQVAC